MDDEYLNPKWNEAGNVHDWRNYVYEDLQEIWLSLSERTRIIIGKNAQDIASEESWD